MIKISPFLFGVISFFFIRCGSAAEPQLPDNQFAENKVEQDTLIAEVADDKEVVIMPQSGQEEATWKSKDHTYPHFIKSELDTIYIGPSRMVKDPAVFFQTERENLMVWIDAGEYIMHSSITVKGKNLIIRGTGNVSLLCDQLYENVMWVTGENIVIDNLHMKHLMRGENDGQNCTGRVIAFDNASNITVQNCDLNGCGLAGLHDNVGNGFVYVSNNHIHNNSLGAYTNIRGRVWQHATPFHPVFKFKSNLIENNGFDRKLEEEIYGDEDAH